MATQAAARRRRAWAAPSRVMLPTFTRDPRVALVAAADPRAGGARAIRRGVFRARPTRRSRSCAPIRRSRSSMWRRRTSIMREHAALAAQHGKHVLVEKPMALTLEECAAMIAAARRAGVHLVVGHSHSFDAPILRTRELIASGEFGAVRMITRAQLHGFSLPPAPPGRTRHRAGRRRGVQSGGASGRHRAPARRRARARACAPRPARGIAARPTEGAYAALLTFENGAFASLTYSGYGHFDSDEFHGWIGEMGQTKTAVCARAAALCRTPREEAAFKNARNYGGAAYQPPADASARASAFRHRSS